MVTPKPSLLLGRRERGGIGFRQAVQVLPGHLQGVVIFSDVLSEGNTQFDQPSGQLLDPGLGFGGKVVSRPLQILADELQQPGPLSRERASLLRGRKRLNRVVEPGVEGEFRMPFGEPLAASAARVSHLLVGVDITHEAGGPEGPCHYLPRLLQRRQGVAIGAGKVGVQHFGQHALGLCYGPGGHLFDKRHVDHRVVEYLFGVTSHIFLPGFP